MMILMIGIQEIIPLQMMKSEKKLQMMKSEKKYTVSWFTEVHALENVLKDLNKESELHFLEIGCYEGKSTPWFIENYLKNEKSSITCVDSWIPDTDSIDKDTDVLTIMGVKDRFEHNVKTTGKIDQVVIKNGLSNEMLFDSEVREKQYDLIFIDGNHTTKYVMEDSVLSWGLLKVGGIMVFDDYKWRLHDRETLRPKLAIDSFCKVYGDYLQIVYNGYRLAVKKMK
jgi:predicted O-methyltransferase YrrM